METAKKLLSMLLAVLMIVSIIPTASIEASAASGSDYTSNSALAAKLNAVFSGDIDIYSNSACTTEVSMPVGTNMNKDVRYWVKSNTTGNTYSGKQCCIYANAVYNKLYNEWVYNGNSLAHSEKVVSGGANTLSYATLNNAGVRCGAYLRTTNKSSGAYNGDVGHSMIILSYNTSNITYLEGNGDGNGAIRITTKTWSDFNYWQLSGKGRYVSWIIQPTTAYYNSIYPTTSAPAQKPTLSLSTDTVSLTIGGTETATVNITLNKNDNKIYTLSPSRSNSNVAISWGDWNGSTVPLYITAKSQGTTVITIDLLDYETREKLYTCKINVYVSAKTYTVSYNANGGTGAPASQFKLHGTALTLSTTKPTRTGYTFLGWSTSSTATSATYSAGGSFTTNANTTLFAVWKANPALSVSTNTVNLIIGQNEDAAIDIKVINDNGNCDIDIDRNNSNAWNSLVLARQLDGTIDGTLYIDAKAPGTTIFTVNLIDLSNNSVIDTEYITVNISGGTYTVKFDSNGGAGAMSNQPHTYGSAQALSANTFTKHGYTFIGWSTSPTATTATYTDKQSVQNLTSVNGGTVTLYAVWRANTYTIKYNANGGIGTMGNQTHTYGTAKELSANTFTRPGYTFMGWSTGSANTTVKYTDKQLVKNVTSTNGNTVTLFAVWKANTYTISYNANGGVGVPSSQTKTHEVDLTLSSQKPTRTGYTFLGWSTSSTATTATYSAGGSFTTNANTTLYAVWKANTYTISYNANGGVGAPSSQTKTYGKTLTLSSTIPTRTGYTFLGWSTSSTATTATYSAGSSFTANANTTLYAVWKKAGHDINNDGIVNSNDTGLYKLNGTWYYVKNGDIDYTFTGLTKHTNGIWYYVENGVLDWGYLGLWKHNGTWYYVQKGQINWNFTGLVKHTNGIWYYVKGAKLNWGYTGLVKHTTGSWFYVQKGQINWNYTGLVKHTNGKYYYVQKGKLNWNYTGYTYYNGKKYKVVNGVKV